MKEGSSRKRLLQATSTLIILSWTGLAFCGEIHDAARDGDLETVQSLLKHNPSLVFSNRGTNGSTPLFWAAMGGHQEIAELLLKYKAHVNAKDDNGSTPLYEAVVYDHINLVRLLLDNGANANMKNWNGQTPLFAAATAGNKQIAELLLAKKASVNVSDRADCGGEYPLHLAATAGYDDVVKLLLAHGAKVDAEDATGVTPLGDAAKAGYSNIVATLLANGADVNAKDDNGTRALAWAASGCNGGQWSPPASYSQTVETNNYMGTIELLLAKGAKINAADATGETALFSAAMNEDTNVLAFLLAHGAQINRRNRLGYTPLGRVVSFHTPFDTSWEARAKILRQYGGQD